MGFSAVWCFFAVVLVVDRTSALTCYTCAGLEGAANSSFTSCLQDPASARNQTCVPPEDICQSVLVELSWLKYIERRCANSSLCASIQNSTSATGSQCCATDLCNDELVPTTLAPSTTTKLTTIATTTTTTTTTPTTLVTTTTPNPTTSVPTDDRYLIYIVVIGVLAGALLIMTVVAVCFCVKYRKTVNKPHPVIQVREYEQQPAKDEKIDTSFSNIKKMKFDYAWRPYDP